MQDIDTKALAIVEQIKRCHAQLSNEVGPVGNIFMIFMHDLVVHFSGILIQRGALEYYADHAIFPCVNKQYAVTPYQLSPSAFQAPKIRSGLKSRLRRLALSRTALGEALPFGYRQNRIAAKWINLLGSHKPFARAFLPRQQEQVELLRELVMQLCSDLEIPGRDAIWHNWQQYVLLHTTVEQQILHERGLLLGTRNNLQNRKLATNYLQQGKEVIAITHGEVANSVMDEPPFGYSERTLCSTLVDYGDFDQDGSFNVPWVSPQRRLYRSGLSAQAVHRPSQRIVLPRRDRCRALYIPTTYHGNGLYGPFHVYEDAVYHRWQRALFGAFAGLTFKVHPKSRAAPLTGVAVDKRPLEECIGDYDLLVFDYFATGSMLALVSNKPVIYCDIGLRRLHPHFVRDLKNRCEYVKIDLECELTPQLGNAFAQCWSDAAVRSNEGITPYVLCRQDSFNWVALFHALDKGESPTT